MVETIQHTTSSRLTQNMMSLLGHEHKDLVTELLQSVHCTSLKAGQSVFRQGDGCDAFIVVLSGQVRVQLTAPTGREITLYRVVPDASCVLTISCLMSHQCYPAEAIVEQDTEALIIPRAAFERALETSTKFRQFVFSGVANHLGNVITKIEQIAFTPIDVRLASVLLELDARDAKKITHHSLAVELGTAREVISRHLKRFETEGWVTLGRGQVTVKAPSALKALSADPDFLCD